MSAPEVCRILAIRHGQTASNAQRRLQGHIDTDLDDTGRWQAQQMGLALADVGVDAIFSSDLRRAHETAWALAQHAGQPVQLDPGLRERHFGFLEGHSYDEIDQRWPEHARPWRQREPDFATGGGESLRGFYTRAVAAASALAARHSGQHLALVTHGGVLDCLYRAATGLGLSEPRTWALGNASINRLLWTPQGFSLVGWDDAQHLDGQPNAALQGVD